MLDQINLHILPGMFVLFVVGVLLLSALHKAIDAYIDRTRLEENHRLWQRDMRH